MTGGVAVIVFIAIVLADGVASEEVLVVGGSGFVGYHTTLELANRGFSPVVLDNFNDNNADPEHWSWRIKRSEELHKKGIKIYHGDLCRVGLLKHFIGLQGIKKIIYLGETVDMSVYVEERLQCFVALLEILRDHKDVKLVYSSSSDAVSKQTVDIDKGDYPVPSSTFGVFKSMEESFAQAYCTSHGILAIGVRPFYPYGPYADSKTTIYTMAEAIAREGPVSLPYNKKQPLSYDFTHVTDIAKGFADALKVVLKTCGLVYDLGSGSPQLATDAADILKKELKKSAKYKEEQVLFTPPVADNTLAKKDFAYSPTVKFQEGVKSFTDWFMKNANTKIAPNINNAHKSKSTTVNAGFVNRSLDEDIKNRRLQERSDAFFKRLQDIRRKYEAQATGPIAKLYTDRKFIFFPNVNSGRDDKKYKNGTSIEKLKKECRLIDECVAFTSEGGLKSRIEPKARWKKVPSGGMYVADIDVCQAGLHNCQGNFTCTHLGPSQYSCGCAKGWTMQRSNCIQTEYVPGIASQKDKERMYHDRLNGHMWQGQKTDTFKEHKGSSIEGGKIYDYPDAHGDIEKLKAACLDTYHCAGFNVKENTLMSEVKQMKGNQPSDVIAYTRNYK